MVAGIIGDKLVKRKLHRLKSKSAQSRVIRSGQGAAMTEISRGIRNAIPPKYKSAKKTIGRNTKGKGDAKQAKVGLGVGKRTKSKKQRDPKRPGLGITKHNIHWLVFGTPPRRGRGSMPNIGEAGGWVKKGFQKSRRAAERKQRQKMRERIKAELAKEK